MFDRRLLSFALTVIFLANFLNYTDRQLVSALEKQIRNDPAWGVMSVTEFGLLWTLFTIGYMICAVPIGLMADRVNRPRLLAVCIVVWSVATITSGMANSKVALYTSRIFIGVGEAGCLVVGPSLISDFFTLRARSRALSVFYLGMPLGGILAYAGASFLSNVLTWRQMFFYAGAPGFVVALLVLFLPDPPRGTAEAESAGHTAHGHGGGSWGDYAKLLRNRTLILVILAQAFAVVILVPLLHFGKLFFTDARGLPEMQAGIALGVMALVGAIGGVTAGVVGDMMARKYKGAYALLAGLGYLAGLPCFFLGFQVQDKTAYLVLLTLGAFFMFLCMPAVNTQIANVVNPRQRATAWALAVFILHLLGDTAAPLAFGTIEQNLIAQFHATGFSENAANALARERAFLYFSFALIPAALCCFIAAITAKADIARVRAEVETQSEPAAGVH